VSDSCEVPQAMLRRSAKRTIHRKRAPCAQPAPDANTYPIPSETPLSSKFKS
jgi:hypothetical protein